MYDYSPYTTSYNYYNSYSSADSTLFAVMMSMLAGMWLFMLAWYVLQVIAQWKIFTKAGEAGWKSIIPIYNMIVLLKIVGMSPWFILINLIPGAGTLVYSVMVSLKLAKVYGKSTGFAVGLIFLGPIFYLILGFGKDEYLGADAAN